MRQTARVRANRANAKRSTGPKSSQGKARSARNAYKHGLSLTAAILPECSPAVQAYVDQLVDEGASADLRSAAIAFAEAQTDVDRVRRVRQMLYEDPQARLKPLTPFQMIRMTEAKLDYLDSIWRIDEETGEEVYADVTREEVQETLEKLSGGVKPTVGLEEGMRELAPQLAKLWRYEKRALSRRDKAAEEYQLLCGAE